MEDIGILLRLEGAESALAAAKQLETTLNNMDKKTYTAKIRMANAKLAAEAADLQKQIHGSTRGFHFLTTARAKAMKATSRDFNVTSKVIKTNSKAIRDMHNLGYKGMAFTAKKMKAIQRQRLLDERAYLNAQKNALDQTAFDYEKTQKTFQTNLVQTGSQLQTLGNTLGRLTAPFTRIFSGALMGAGFTALNKVTEGLSSAFQRYDIIETYDKRLNQLGLDASKKFKVGTDEARTAVENLDESVRGLPTGLDEMIDSMSRYAGATGDVERATKLAIAANNAFIAGQMDDRQKLFTERQLQSLAGGAELSSNQWDSLRRNAPLAIRTVAKEMKMGVQEMIDSLKQGKISGQDFLDTFIKVGTEGKIRSAAQKMKMTWSAVSQNITNAFSRMGYNVLTTLDKVFEKATGRNLLQDILGVDKNGEPTGGGIKQYIDDISESVQKWIKANPDAILNFWEKLKSFDIAGVFRGFAKEVAPVAKLIGNLFSALGGEGVGRALGKAAVWSKGLMLVGGALKGLAKPLSAIGAKGMGVAHGAGLLGIGKMLGGLSKIGTGIKVAAFGRLADAFRATGNLAKADTFRKLGNVAKAGKKLKGVTQAARAMDSLQGSLIGLGNKALNIAGILAFGKSIEWISKAMQTISKTNFDPNKIGAFALSAGGFIAEFAAISQLLGAKGVVTGIAQVSRLLGTAEIAAISKTIQEMAKAMNDIGKVKMPDDGKIDSVLSAMGKFLDGVNGTSLFTSLGKQFSASAIGKTAKAVSSVAKALTSIDQMKVNIKKVRTKLFGKDGKGGEDSFIGVMDDLVNSFDGDWFTKMVKSWESSNVAKIFSSAASMITDLNTIVTTKIKPADIKKLSGENGTLTMLKDGLRPIIDSMNEMYNMDISQESFLSQRGGLFKPFDKGNKKSVTTLGAQARGYAGLMKNLGDALTNVSSTLSAIGHMKKKLDTLKGLYGTDDTGAYDFSSVANAISGIAGALTPLTEGNAFTTLEQASMKLEDFDFTHITNAFNQGIIPLITAYSQIKGILYEAGMSFDASNPLASDSFGISMIIAQVMGSLKAINDAFTEIGDMGAFQGNMVMLDSAITNLQSMFSKLSSIQTLFGGETGGAPAIGGEIGGGLSSIGQTIKTIVNDVSQAAAQAPVLMANAMMLQVAFATLKGSFNSLDSIATTAQTAATTIQTAVNTLNAIGTQIIEVSITISGEVDDGGIPAKVSAISTKIDTAMALIRPLYAKKVKVSITGSVSDGGIPGRIRGVAQAIRNAFAGIPTSLTRHVSVNVYGSVNKIGDFGGGLSTGGMVTTNGKPLYRDRGGNIFKPKGTDTIPAMLTPGEYVMRRKAVDTFGARFFQGLNHLDLHGALRALSVRAGQNILPKASTIINNNKTTNNYNNFNVPVTNNSHNESAGINRAGRIIHALQH